MISRSTEFTPHVEAGKLRLLATLGAQRAAAFPGLPTLREAGVDIVNESGFGIGVPRGTDAVVIQRLRHAFRAAFDEPAAQAVCARFQLPLIAMTPAEYAAFARRTVEAERAALGRPGLLRKD